MIIVKCQHSGIEFEANTSRTKQHPKVAAFKNSNVKNYYRQACESLDEAAGEDYQTIDEYLTIVNRIFKAKTAKRDAEITERKRQQAQEEKARYEARKQREATNAKLRANGYCWMKDDDDGYQPQFNDGNWHLISPDGYDVTVAEALHDIEIGVENAIAQRAKAKAQAEKEASEKAQAEKEETEKRAQAESEVMGNAQEVEPFDYSNFELIYSHSDTRVSVINHKVFRGQISGITCGVTYSYYSNLGESIHYYCDNPEAADLVEIKKQSASALFW